MESWEVLEIAIPRKESKRVALLLNVCADYVRRWRREPEGEDTPSGTGQRSILDRVCELIDACFLVNPKDAGLIIQHINNHYNNLIQIHAKPINTCEEQAKHCAELLKESCEGINKLQLDGCSKETLTELVQMRFAVDNAISAVEKTLKGKE
jgi:hypothetical protein